MSEEMIVRNCSPTLAGLKTGNMFSCPFESEKQMKDSLRSWNKILVKKGLRVLPLRFNNGNALIYIFRPSYLLRDLRHGTADRLLRERGYRLDTPEVCVRHLKKRIGEQGEFPHEVGLFLGYPPEDVDGFIENKADGYKAVGCWKVYGDAEAAQKMFRKFKKCTAVYSKKLAAGRSVELMTVAI